MILGKVVGEVWATKKHPKLLKYKLLIVQPYGLYEYSPDVDQVVAIDAGVDAGIGDDVIVCMGQPARWMSEGRVMPVEAAIMAVVDEVAIDEEAFKWKRRFTFMGGEPRNLKVGKFATEGRDYISERSSKESKIGGSQ